MATPYELGLQDGRTGTIQNEARVDVTGRVEYERGFRVGQNERLAAGLPAAATEDAS